MKLPEKDIQMLAKVTALFAETKTKPKIPTDVAKVDRAIDSRWPMCLSR